MTTMTTRIPGLGTIRTRDGIALGVVLTQARSLSAGYDGSEHGASGPDGDRARADLRSEIRAALHSLGTTGDDVEVMAQRPGTQAWTVMVLHCDR